MDLIPSLRDDLLREVSEHPWSVLVKLVLVCVCSVAIPLLLILSMMLDGWLTSVLR